MEAFERVYELWRRKRLGQRQAAELLKMSKRTFRRWVARYNAEGAAALRDRRLGCSPRRAPPEEVAAVEALYRDCNFHEVRETVEVNGLFDNSVHGPGLALLAPDSPSPISSNPRVRPTERRQGRLWTPHQEPWQDERSMIYSNHE